MRGFSKLLIWIVALVVILVVTAYVAVSLKGKVLIEHYLSSLFKQPVEIEEVRILLPLGVRLHKLEIQNVISTEDVRVKFSIPFWYNQYLIVAKVELNKPQVTIIRDQIGKWHWEGDVPLEGANQSAASTVQILSSKEKALATMVKHKFAGILLDFLQIEQGTLEFNDVNRKNLHVILGGLELKARGITYPLMDRGVVINFAGTIINEDSPFFRNKVQGEGTINLPARNMETALKVLDSKGQSALSANIQSVHNDMTVKGKIDVGRLAANVNQHVINESSLEGFIYSALRVSGVDLDMDYVFKTTMDDFHIEKLTIGGNVVFSEGPEGEQAKLKKDLETLSKQFESFGKQLSGENNPKPEAK